MRVAIVTTSYPAYDGDPSGHFVHAEVRDLEAAGHDVTVIAPMQGRAFGWPGAAARVRERPLRALDAAAWMGRAVIALRRSRAERVIAHWSVPCGFPVADAALAHDRSFELEVVSHGGDVRLLTALPPTWRDRAVQRLVGRAKRWRFVSETLLDDLVQALPRPTAVAVRALSYVAPSPLGAIDHVRAAARERRNALAGRKLFVCAGRLVQSKRIDRVIDYVASSKGHEAPVLVVLGDGPERARLEKVAARWQLDARFLGRRPRDEALAWIGAADELVHASRAEGLSTVVREAEHLGVKVTRL